MFFLKKHVKLHVDKLKQFLALLQKKENNLFVFSCFQSHLGFKILNIRLLCVCLAYMYIYMAFIFCGKVPLCVAWDVLSGGRWRLASCRVARVLLEAKGAEI